MSDPKVALYIAWNRPDEANAQLGILDNRWATIFENRRVNWPRSEHLAGWRHRPRHRGHDRTSGGRKLPRVRWEDISMDGKPAENRRAGCSAAHYRGKEIAQLAERRRSYGVRGSRLQRLGLLSTPNFFHYFGVTPGRFRSDSNRQLRFSERAILQ